MTDYPQCEKLRSVATERHAIEEFLEWAQDDASAVLVSARDGEQFRRVNTDALVLRFFDVDPKALSREREAMLDEVRRLNP